MQASGDRRCHPFGRMQMYKKLAIASLAALVLSACVVTPPRGAAVVVAPALPAIVEFDVEPYYFYRGYYYYYENARWRYSSSRSGPWVELPRSHYPREIRFKGRREDWRGDNRDRDDRRWDRDDQRRWERDKERRRDRDDDRRGDDDDRRRDRRGDDGGDRPWWDRNDERH